MRAAFRAHGARMILLTYILKGSEHRPVLGFKTVASLTTAVDQSLSAAEVDQIVIITDDYGQKFFCYEDDIVGRVITDLDKNNEMKVERAIARMKAENQFQKDLQSDPTLSFLVGNAGSIFPPEE